MSKHTLKIMIDALNDDRIKAIPDISPLNSTFRLLWEREIENISAEKTLFFYYDNDADGAGNSDCYVYEGLKGRFGAAIALQQLEPRLEQEPCDLASYDLAALFNYVTSPKDRAFAAPSQLYMFVMYPDQEIRARYSKSVADEWFLFNKAYGTPSGRIDPKLEYSSRVHIPTWTYINEEKGSLSDIAYRMGGENLPWQLIWELNLNSAKDPAIVDEGVELLLPAMIESWEQIDPSALSAEEWSAKMYGNTAYSDLVQTYIDATLDQGGEEFVSVPVFEAGVATTPAVVSASGKL